MSNYLGIGRNLLHLKGEVLYCPSMIISYWELMPARKKSKWLRDQLKLNKRSLQSQLGSYMEERRLAHLKRLQKGEPSRKTLPAEINRVYRPIETEEYRPGKQIRYYLGAQLKFAASQQLQERGVRLKGKKGAYEYSAGNVTLFIEEYEERKKRPDRDQASEQPADQFPKKDAESDELLLPNGETLLVLDEDPLEFAASSSPPKSRAPIDREPLAERGTELIESSPFTRLRMAIRQRARQKRYLLTLAGKSGPPALLPGSRLTTPPPVIREMAPEVLQAVPVNYIPPTQVIYLPLTAPRGSMIPVGLQRRPLRPAVVTAKPPDTHIAQVHEKVVIYTESSLRQPGSKRKFKPLLTALLVAVLILGVAFSKGYLAQFRDRFAVGTVIETPTEKTVSDAVALELGWAAARNPSEPIQAVRIYADQMIDSPSNGYRVKGHMTLGLGFFMRREYHLAIEQYSRSISVIESLELNQPSDLALAYLYRAQCWFFLADFQAAGHDIDLAQKVKGSRLSRFTMDYWVSVIRLSEGKTDESLLHAQDLLNASIESRPVYIASAYAQISMCYLQMGEMGASAEALLKSKLACEKIPDANNCFDPTVAEYFWAVANELNVSHIQTRLENFGLPTTDDQIKVYEKILRRR